MIDCKKVRKHMEDFLIEEAPFVDNPELESHLESCEPCREMIEFHRELLKTGESVQGPSTREFCSMRKGVMASLSKDRVDPARITGTSFFRDFMKILNAYPGFALSVFLLILVGAVFTGRWTVRDTNREIISMNEILMQGNQRKSHDEFWDNPLSYTDVVARPIGNGNLALSFNVSQHVKLETSLNSPLSKDVLLQAILDPSVMGTRIKAMALTPGIQDQRLKDALIYTLEYDPSLAIRVEAFDTLTQFPEDESVQMAMLHVLRQDQDVQMRLMALEYLSGKNMKPETLRHTINEIQLEGDAALRYKADSLNKTL